MKHRYFIGLLAAALLFPIASVVSMDAPTMAAPEPSDSAALQLALADYHALAARGGWPRFPTGGKKIEPGAHDARILTLRDLLAKTGDYAGSTTPSDHYDPALADAVKLFQDRHGLTDDGVIGKSTMLALDTMVEARIIQMEATLTRMNTAMPLDTESRYLLINIPEFRLRAFEGGLLVADMKVITGAPNHPTPLFNNAITYVSFNPHWGVPQKIAAKELLPKIVKDPDYLKIHNYAVYTLSTEAREEVDPDSIDWSGLGTNHFPYQLRQRPGEDNALGKIKFGMIGTDDIYLHSTAAPSLFSKDERALSHGCIRVEHPRELAQFVFKGMETFYPDKVDELYNDDKSKIVKVTPLPVHLVYWTAWVDKATGRLQFRKDVYGLND